MVSSRASDASSGTSDIPPAPSPNSTPTSRSFWVTFAVGSGAFAAFNGVFAKLSTTGAATEGIANGLSRFFGVEEGSSMFVEGIVRALFFGLNLLSNAIMWILFTRALTAGNSTTRVSVINTSSNFLVTAILGMIVFSEGLPLGWWAGAALLVAGSVIIGARDDNRKIPDKSNDQVRGDSLQMDIGPGSVDPSVTEQEPFRDHSEDEEDDENDLREQRQSKGPPS